LSAQRRAKPRALSFEEANKGLQQADGPFRCSLVKVAKVLQQRVGDYEAVHVDLQEEAVAREDRIEVAKELARLPPE
jgi:hypothetical protein|tara:strand:- start:324 stop:554 length:231 start_codon:yes stop_codon:yes gene_type:complete